MKKRKKNEALRKAQKAANIKAKLDKKLKAKDKFRSAERFISSFRKVRILFHYIRAFNVPCK